jgi:hypothetical protein
LNTSGANKFLKVIQENILTNKTKDGYDIDDKTSCAGLPGR